MRRARGALPAIGKPGRVVGEQPANEVENFFKCEVCDHMIDMRNLGEVLEHEGPHEAPLKN